MAKDADYFFKWVAQQLEGRFYKYPTILRELCVKIRKESKSRDDALENFQNLNHKVARVLLNQKPEEPDDYRVYEISQKFNQYW